MCPIYGFFFYVELIVKRERGRKKERKRERKWLSRTYQTENMSKVHLAKIFLIFYLHTNFTGC